MSIKAVSNGCPAAKAFCLCELPPGHDGPHRCACRGSWADDGKIIAYPLGTTNPIEAMIDYLDDIGGGNK